MSETYDVIVVGFGAMGSAAVAHLAMRGVRVLGLDQFAPPHALGSSSGETRVIREAYFEHPTYVPLVQRAYTLWEELEKWTQTKLYLKTGGIMIGPPGSTIIEGATRSATEHQLEYCTLDATEIHRRFPGFTPPPEFVGVLEPRAGILFPERCIEAHLKVATELGAEFRMNERVVSWSASPERVRVETNQGSYEAGRLVLCSGPWLPRMIAELGIKFIIERQVLLWFRPHDRSLFSPDRFPVHLWEYEPDKFIYGFPDIGNGVKLAFHHQGETCTPDEVDRDIGCEEIGRLRVLAERFLPEANGPTLRGSVCLYTNTDDGQFLLDLHPNHSNVVIASPCSGHGFKFASAIGEVLADLALNGKSRFNLSFFSLDRLRR